MIEYKVLPTKFRRGEYEYSLIMRIGDIAIYEQSRIKTLGLVFGYTVARIRRVKSTKLPNGKILPFRESFPSPSQIGIRGWFYQEKSKKFALAHFHEFVDKYEQSVPPDKIGRIKVVRAEVALVIKAIFEWGTVLPYDSNSCRRAS